MTLRNAGNILAKPSLRDLIFGVVPNVHHKWYNLGVQLFDDKDVMKVLQTIECDYRGDVEACCNKMFERWLELVSHASWAQLIDGLKAPNVQLHKLADDLLIKLKGKISDEHSITQHKEVQQDNLELLLKDAVEKGNIINVKHIKIFLTGASAAGKTSFRRSLFREDFAEEYESTELQETKHAHVLSVVKVKNDDDNDDDDDDDDDDGDYDTKWLELTAEQQINHFRALLQLPKPAKESDDDSQNIITHDFEVPEILVDRLDKSKGLESHLEIPTPLKLITIVDTGGQPEFIDMLPAIVNCPTINFVVIDMTKKLTDPVEVHYKPKKWVSSKRDREKHKDEVKEEKKIKVEVRHELKEEDKVKKGDIVEVIHHKVKENLAKKENNIEMKVQYRVKEEDEIKKKDEVEVVIHYKENEDRKPISYLSYSYEHLIKLLMSVTSDSKNLPVLQKQDNSKKSNADKRASRCHIIFVGTHKDKIKEKDIENLNNQLDVLVGDDQKYPSVLKTPDNTILYGISNINSGNAESKEIKSIRKQVEMVAKQVPDENIPISWLILEIQVKAFCESSSKHFVTVKKFSEIANIEASVEEQNVDVVLQYFHSLGIFLYFKDVDEMKNYVIVDHQWFYTTLCKVVCLSLDSRSIYYDNEIEKCRKNGLLCKEKLLSINWNKEIKMPIEPIINLLSQKKILAEYKNDDGEEFYYFPCMLHHCQQYQDKYKYLLLEPLLIRFLSGFLPRGFFCLLVVYLLKNLPSQWSEVKTNLKYGNVITFRINKEFEFYLRLQDKICYLEVEVRHHKYNNHVERDLSDELYSLQKCLHAVCDALNLDHNKLEYGFLCTGNLMDDHMVVLDSIDSPTFLKQCEKCQTENEMHHLHHLWFKSQLTKDMQPQDSEPNMKWMHKLIIPQICSQWIKVAYYLDYPIAKKNEIEESQRSDPYKCCEKLMEDWLASDRGVAPKTWYKLILVLKEIPDLSSAALSIEGSLLQEKLLFKDGKDETQITRNHKAVNQSKQYSQTFDQFTQRSTRDDSSLSPPQIKRVKLTDTEKRANKIKPENLKYTEKELNDKVSDVLQNCSATEFTLYEDNANEDCKNVRLLLMTVNNNEFFAVLYYMANKHKGGDVNTPKSLTVKSGTRFFIGEFAHIPTALVKQVQQGSSESQSVVGEAIGLFPNLLAIVAVGVCGTFGDLGDVIVSSTISCYVHNKQDGRIIRHDPDCQGSHLLASFLNANHNWKFNCTKETTSDQYQSRLYFKPFLSSSTLVACKEFRDKIREDICIEAMGIEMEGAGIVKAREYKNKNNIHFIIVKAGCDYADENKSKEWQPVAAMAAADLVHFQFDKPAPYQCFKDDSSSSPPQVKRMKLTDSGEENTQAVNHPNQYPQAFNQSRQPTTKGKRANRIKPENLKYTESKLKDDVLDIVKESSANEFALYEDDADEECENVQLLLMTVNDNEFFAVLYYMANKHKSKDFNAPKPLIRRGTRFFIGEFANIPTALVQHAQGSAESLFVTFEAINLFGNLKAIVAVGVCATFGELGDVIVSSRIVGYANIKYDKDGTIVRRDSDTKASRQLTNYLQAHNGWEFNCTKETNSVQSQLCFKPFLSSSTLVAFQTFRDKIREDICREAMGIEMEGIGIINALEFMNKRHIDFAIVKAGCDYANEGKNKEWQPVAAMAAADLVYFQFDKPGPYKWFTGKRKGPANPVTVRES